jgi:DNA polymerase-1
MKLRGVVVDYELRATAISDDQASINRLNEQLNYLAREGIGMFSVNFASPKQLKELFYERLQIPPIKKRRFSGGEYTYTATVDRDALEQLDYYFLAQPLIAHILGLRDLAKKVSVLRTDIDSDGRMRTSYNIAGTSTGRFSSSLSDFGTGTNLQNIEDRLRSVFVADPGMKFAYIDLEQAESRLVGAIEWNLFKDGTYLDACESGDLHTRVCQLAWKGLLPWTNDPRRDKELAEQPFYRQHSYRHMAKVLGHGTNYNGKPHTMAKHTKLDAKLIAEFQSKYFTAFPAHQRWHASVASQVMQYGRLDTLTGRRRWFFGRRNDDATIREAIAYDPQGSVADILNQGMLKVWRLGLCQLLLQVHDAILIQYPEDLESKIIPVVMKEILVPIELSHGRKLVIPSEAKVGWNWASFSENNPDGLKKFAGHDARKRQRQAPSRLDNLLHSSN